MNIKAAKDEVKKTVKMYLEKEKDGEYRIPIVRQRPIFMVGAPGIGKTAIIEQVAAEMDIALVSYSMTHHTRQSAVGLPYLAEKNYMGKTYTVAEYTMSEIIASVYEVMEKSGKKEGILFLDEINCVSETLAPAMLLFLQYKRFGNQQVPDGWVVVTAGNPPQFNKSVKEFDIATLDRLKLIDVEDDYNVWKEYAYQAGIHPAILSFLDLNEKYFYRITTSVDGKQYITARGWEDLSSTLKAYERNQFEVTKELVMEYITDKECAQKFAVFYDLYRKYRMNYAINDVLAGNVTEATVEKAQKASFDERLSVISMMIEAIGTEARETMIRDAALKIVVRDLRSIKRAKTPMYDSLREKADAVQGNIDKAKAANALSKEDKNIWTKAIGYFEKYREELTDITASAAVQFKEVKDNFTKDVKSLERRTNKISKMLEGAFTFIESAWGNNQEMVMLVTELTVNKMCLNFISNYGCDKFFQYNKSMMIYDQEDELKYLISQIDDEETALSA